MTPTLLVYDPPPPHRKRGCAHHVSALVSRSSGPGSDPGRTHCVMFFYKTLYFDLTHLASLHPGVLMGTGELNVRGNPEITGLATHPGGSKNTSSRFMLFFTIVPGSW